eukprot:3572948-Alexandrium_andersonii.AAC.2
MRVAVYLRCSYLRVRRESCDLRVKGLRMRFAVQPVLLIAGQLNQAQSLAGGSAMLVVQGGPSGELGPRPPGAA